MHDVPNTSGTWGRRSGQPCPSGASALGGHFEGQQERPPTACMRTWWSPGGQTPAAAWERASPGTRQGVEGGGRGVHRAVGRPCEGPTAQTGDGRVGPTAVHGRDGRAQAESERASHGWGVAGSRAVTGKQQRVRLGSHVTCPEISGFHCEWEGSRGGFWAEKEREWANGSELHRPLWQPPATWGYLKLLKLTN